MVNKKGVTLFRVITVLVIVGILGGVYFVFSTLFRDDTVIPPEKIAAVAREDMVRSVVATGKIEPVSKIDIKAKASGIIQYLYVEEGDTVRSGQVLLELDRQQLEASLREAEAVVMARKAMVEKAESDRTSAELSFERAKAESENPDLEFARRDWERTQKLFADTLVAQSQLDDAEQKFKAALVQDRLLKKSVQLRESEFLTSQKAVAQAKADLYAAEAACTRVSEDLRNATIRSPIDGVVLKRYLNVGDAVSSILQLGSNATLIMTIGDGQALYFKGDVDESDVGEIKVGLPVQLTVETFRDRVFHGKVIHISPMGEEKENVTRFEVRAEILDNADALRVNMSANAEIVLSRREQVLTIPQAALVFNEQKEMFVDRLRQAGKKQEVTRVAVKTGLNNGSKVEVTGGLKEKDQVVLQ
jgi:HlyD family secretion protein